MPWGLFDPGNTIQCTNTPPWLDLPWLCVSTWAPSSKCLKLKSGQIAQRKTSKTLWSVRFTLSLQLNYVRKTFSNDFLLIYWIHFASFTLCCLLNWPLVRRRLRLLDSTPNVHQNAADCFPIAAQTQSTESSTLMSIMSIMSISLYCASAVKVTLCSRTFNWVGLNFSGASFFKAYVMIWIPLHFHHITLFDLWLWLILPRLHSLSRPFLMYSCLNTTIWLSVCERLCLPSRHYPTAQAPRGTVLDVWTEGSGTKTQTLDTRASRSPNTPQSLPPAGKRECRKTEHKCNKRT